MGRSNRSSWGPILLFLGVFIAIAWGLVSTWAEDTEFTVTKTERHEDGYYLVYTEDSGTFKVADSWIPWRWDSSDEYGKIEVGNSYTADTYGWRIPFFSSYENIFNAEVVER